MLKNFALAIALSVLGAVFLFLVVDLNQLQTASAFAMTTVVSLCYGRWKDARPASDAGVDQGGLFLRRPE